MGSRIVFIVCFVTLLVLEPAFSQREMWMSSTDANISKRASKQPKPVFQTWLGHQHVENMQRIGENLLLVGLRENTPKLKSSEYIMVNTDNGEVLWRWPCSKGQYSTFWVSDSYVVLKADETKKTTFYSLETATGELIWTKSFPLANLEFVVEPDTEQLIVYSFKKGKISLTSISMKGGNSTWEQQITETWTKAPFLLIDEHRIFVFSNTISAWDTDTGTVIYELDNIPVSKLSPLAPTFDDSHLFLVDDHGKLVGIEKANGKVLWQKELPTGTSITNITSSPKHIYVRGEIENSDFRLISYSKADINPIWTFSSDQAITSNLIEKNDTLFAASSSKLYVIDTKSGSTVYEKTVTKTGRSFPISLRMSGEHVVYIGELVIAGFKSADGRMSYKHGFSPIDPNLHYNGLDASLPKLEQRLETLKNYKSSGVVQTASNQRAYYQKMADKNYSDYLKYRQLNQSGSSYKANMARNRSRTYSSMARMQAGLTVSLAILELGNALQQLIKANAAEAEIRKQEYFRKSILEVYNNALTEDYVFRPNLKHFSTPDQYICVSIINLSNGKKKDHFLSPQYLEYGLWNLVDFEKGIIYHHGVGMDPSKYKISKSRRTTLVKFKTVETFLIGQPMN